MRALPCALLLFAGCTCDPIKPEPDPTCQTSPLNVDAVFVEGQSGTVELGVGTICFTGQDVHLRDGFGHAKEAIVTVVDPDNQAVPFSATAPRFLGDQIGFENTTQVTFTPDRPGLWTVAVSFEPGIGKVQHALAVAAVRKDAGSTIVPTDLPDDCQQYGQLAGGALACVRPVATGGLELVTGTRRYPGSKFVIDGDSVVRLARGITDWRVDVLDPDAGTTSPIASLPESDAEPFVASHQGQVWLAHNLADAGSRVIQCQRSDGGYLLSATRLFDATVDQAIALDDRAVVVTHPVTGTQDMFFFDGGDNGFSVVVPIGKLFTFPADGGAVRTLGGPLGATGVWADEAAGWIMGPPTRIAMNTRDGLSFISGLDLADVTPRFLPLSVGRSSLKTPGPLFPAAPVLTIGDQRGVLTLGPVSAGYEVFDPGPDYAPVSSATRSHAFARSKDQKTMKVFTR